MIVRLAKIDAQTLSALLDETRTTYSAERAAGHGLQLLRGSPPPVQAALSNDLLGILAGFDPSGAEVDVRVYGGDKGLDELRRIFAPIYRVPHDQFLALDNSSVGLMYDAMSFLMDFGSPGAEEPWRILPGTMICPVPGYDRHFDISRAMGQHMVPVGMFDDGPDMVAVRRLVADPAVRGMWIVPMYSNPTGHTVSREVVQELVGMETAAPDFRIFWDNAYAMHHLVEEGDAVVDVLGLARAAGNEDRVLTFGSLSKVTFGGAGVAFFGASPRNVDWYLDHRTVRTIGPDKVNQLAHAKFFQTTERVLAHMEEHRRILAPKADIVDAALSEQLSEWEVARWDRPRGGYFVSLYCTPGCAARTIALAKECGVDLLPPGACFPYGADPSDSHIRIPLAPLGDDDLRTAMRIVALCALLAALEQEESRRSAPMLPT